MLHNVIDIHGQSAREADIDKKCVHAPLVRDKRRLTSV